MVRQSTKIPRQRWVVGGLLGVGVLINYIGQINLPVAPIATGLIFGSTNNFSGAFLVAGVVLLIGIFFYIVVLGRIEPIRAPQ